MDKAARIAAWSERLRSVRAKLTATADAARSATRVDGDHRPANRGERAAVTSQGYLTAGLTQRVAELDAALDLLALMDGGVRDRAVTGAEVTVEDEDGAERTYLILPGGDGTELDGVAVISPEAPVAKALWGRREDDDAVVVRAGRRIEVVITTVG